MERVKCEGTGRFSHTSRTERHASSRARAEERKSRETMSEIALARQGAGGSGSALRRVRGWGSERESSLRVENARGYSGGAVVRRVSSLGGGGGRNLRSRGRLPSAADFVLDSV